MMAKDKKLLKLVVSTMVDLELDPSITRSVEKRIDWGAIARIAAIANQVLLNRYNLGHRNEFKLSYNNNTLLLTITCYGTELRPEAQEQAINTLRNILTYKFKYDDLKTNISVKLGF
jgi:hypothetical protein